ncbi:MAG: hypothetical protein AMXMBFR33_55890 [Candidatus Xenobia bacterium]
MMTISPALPQSPLSQHRTVSSPAGLLNQNGADGFRPSQDLLDRQGQMGAAMLAQGIAGSHFDGILRAQAQQLMVAASSGTANTQSLAEQLMKDYQKARETGATISPETEELIKKALEMVQGGQQQPQAGGGTPEAQGAAPVGNGGGGNSGGASPSGNTGGASTNRGGGRNSGGARQTGNGNGTRENSPSSGPRNTNSTTPSTPENPDAAAVERVHDRVAQGTPENCSATAIIKAMQHQWGAEAMQMETMPDGNVRVTMRDGYSAVLTPEQIRQAREASDYSGRDPAAVEQAARMNAAAAQRYAQENGVSYEQALQHINTRQYPDEIARYFGVAAQSVDPRTLDGHGYGIVYNGEHAANVMRGPRGQLYQDDHGRIPRGPDGRRQPYNGNVISNGQNTGPATRALIIRDVNPRPGESGQVPGLSRQEWRGYVGERPRPATSGGATGEQGPRPATSSGSGNSASSTTRGTRAPGGSRGGGSTSTVAKNTTRTTRKSSSS